MTIRTFAMEDFDAVERLWEACLPDAAPYNAPRRVIRDKMTLQRELFFVADVDGGVVGTAMAGYDGHRGGIYAVAVHPAYRRRGIGRRLVDHAVQALSALGCPKVNLQVRAANAVAVAFYRSIGFSIEDRISMGRRIAEAGVRITPRR